MGILSFVAGIALIVIGAFGVYNAWGRFNTGFKSAEKIAPLFTGAATVVLGLLFLIWQFDIWWAVLGLLLFGLGYLLRGPNRTISR
ncbi:hypothetical protein [Candidatus Chlorohelix sp.]|uniref:hypothetical protein n=1 Tax=Candidatus Chlorohelix sp. TaxID=3139201 RepID=UPI00303CD9E5